MSIGERIRAERLRRGIEKGQLAERAGIDSSMLYRIEYGKTSPSVRTVTAIADALGMDAGALLSDRMMASSKAEEVLLTFYRDLEPEQRKTIMATLLEMADRPRVGFLGAMIRPFDEANDMQFAMK